MDDYSLEYAKQNKNDFWNQVISNKIKSKRRRAYFMAGTPGAGKSEFATSLLELNQNLVIIDADFFRSQFPGYDGTNSSNFQKGASKLVHITLDNSLKYGYSFVLDGTFAIESATKNIERALNKGFEVTIHFVYQEPLVAWEYTKKRQEVEGRHVPKDVFVNAYFKSRDNLIKVKDKFGDEIDIHIVMKNYDNNATEMHFDVDNIEMVLPKTELEEILT